MRIEKKLFGCLLSIIFVVILAIPVFAAKEGTKGLADLPPAAQMAFSEAMGRDDAAYHGDRVQNGYRLKNRELTARFDATGASVAGWRLAIAGIGRGGKLMPLMPANPEMKANRIEYRRGEVTEWYVNGPLGLEQGFTLERAPAVKAAGTIALAVALPKEMEAVIQGGRTDVLLTGRGDSRPLSYGRLAAWDAEGKSLPAWFEIAASGTDKALQIRVDDSAARYPIVIDPFIEQQQLTAADGAADDRFGYSVAVSDDGNTALIGAYKNSSKGAAYVFNWSGTTWSYQAKLTAADGAAGDFFGYSVSLNMDGNMALIGAQGKDLLKGAAYVFTRNGTAWSQQQKLTPSDPAEGDYFGISVALGLDGFLALIGAKGKDSDTGAAYMFTRSGTTWSQEQKLTASDAAAGDIFGISVALESFRSTALIGASGKSSSAGAAYVFTWLGLTWTEQQKLIPSDPVASDRFGISVALGSDGNTALIGAATKDSLTGAAYAFTRSGTTWSQQEKLTPADPAGGDYFGCSVALGSDGNSALIGAYGKSSFAGAAYSFTRSGTTWSQQNKLTASDGAANDQFGYAVALGGGGSTVLIGAYGKNSSEGEAYVTLSFGLCSAGNYYNGSVCTPCAVGYYQTAGMNRSCIPAPAGFFVDATGASSAAPCPAGWYQSLTGQWDCIKCQAGKYQPSPGQSSCIDAPAGFFISAMGSSSATPCLPGTYQSSTGQTSCTSCAAGTYQNTTGQTSCIPAPVGTVAINMGEISVTPCAAGMFQDSPGNFACMDCQAGKYQPSTGQSSCIDAPAGFYVASPGATSATPCSAGTCQSSTGTTSCVICAPNTLQPATGQTSCLAIPKAATTIVTDPSSSATLYAGIDTAGIYKSIDSGANWTAATTQPLNKRVKALVLKPGDSTKQFVATYGGGVFASTDSGVIWNACATQPTNLNVVSLTIDTGGKLYAGTEAGVFVSSDSCGTWSAINTGLP